MKLPINSPDKKEKTILSITIKNKVLKIIILNLEQNSGAHHQTITMASVIQIFTKILKTEIIV